jgi:HPt (histidine-containing phosphotransfer) domain-containing protein
VGFLLDTFVEDTVGLLREFRAAVDAGDTATARRALHTVIGSGSNLGFDALTRIASDRMTSKAPFEPGFADVLAEAFEDARFAVDEARETFAIPASRAA